MFTDGWTTERRPVSSLYSLNLSVRGIKKYISFSFAHTKAQVTICDLGIKWVKVNPGS